MKTGFSLCGNTTKGKPCSGPVLALYGIAVWPNRGRKKKINWFGWSYLKKLQIEIVYLIVYVQTWNSKPKLRFRIPSLNSQQLLPGTKYITSQEHLTLRKTSDRNIYMIAKLTGSNQKSIRFCFSEHKLHNQNYAFASHHSTASAWHQIYYKSRALNLGVST